MGWTETKVKGLRRWAAVAGGAGGPEGGVPPPTPAAHQG